MLNVGNIPAGLSELAGEGKSKFAINMGTLRGLPKANLNGGVSSTGVAPEHPASSASPGDTPPLPGAGREAFPAKGIGLAAWRAAEGGSCVC